MNTKYIIYVWLQYTNTIQKGEALGNDEALYNLKKSQNILFHAYWALYNIRINGRIAKKKHCSISCDVPHRLNVSQCLAHYGRPSNFPPHAINSLSVNITVLCIFIVEYIYLPLFAQALPTMYTFIELTI